MVGQVALVGGDGLDDDDLAVGSDQDDPAGGSFRFAWLRGWLVRFAHGFIFPQGVTISSLHNCNGPPGTFR